MNYALGIDIGATNIKAVAVSPAGKLLTEVNTPTGDTGSKSWMGNVLLARQRVHDTMNAVPKWTGLAAPGLAAKNQRSIRHMPGRLAGLEGLNWQKAFQAKGMVPVLNDAHAALLGELWQGAAHGKPNAILLTLGTGVGGAACVDGRLLRGNLGRAGHLGHISLNPDGAPDIVKTPGSLEDAIGECSIRARSKGRFATTKELVTASNRGDADARNIWLTSVRALAAAIASLINVLDPAVVVIGGGIAKARASLFRPLTQYLDEFEWRPGGARVRIVPARLGESAGAFGAAWNAMHYRG